jgi:ribosomal protein S8
LSEATWTGKMKDITVSQEVVSSNLKSWMKTELPYVRQHGQIIVDTTPSVLRKDNSSRKEHPDNSLVVEKEHANK